MSLAIAIITVLVAAFPVRFAVPLGVVDSITLLDVLLISSPFLVVICNKRGAIKFGSTQMLLLVAVPLIVSSVSLIWTVSFASTLKAILVSAEAMVAYVLAVTVFGRLSVQTITKCVSLFVLTVVSTAFLSRFHVPGFDPQILGSLSSDARAAFILSYHARLSHPFFGLSNNLATILAFFPFLLMACAQVTCQRRYSWVALICLFAIFATLSRGVALALICAWVLWLMLRPRRLLSKGNFRLIAYGGVTLILLAGFVLANGQVQKHLKDRLSVANVEARFDAYAAAVDAVFDKPFRGYGAGTQLRYIESVPLKNSHNAYLQQLFYFGLFMGALTNLALILLPLATRCLRVQSRAAVQVKRAVTYSVIVELLIFMTQASFEGTVLRVMFYFSIGIGVALVQATDRQSQSVVQHQSHT